jgi:hypothetical protein
MNSSYFFFILHRLSIVPGFFRAWVIIFLKKLKKMLDMPHGGIVCSNSPVECFLKYQDASSPKAAHIPVSRLFS